MTEHKVALPHWGEADHRNPVHIAGATRTEYVHVIALFIAGTADVGMFFQIVQLVMEQQILIVLLVVTGFTAVVLYLAHAAGVLLRDARSRGLSQSGNSFHVRLATWWTNRFAAYLCVLIWLALGLVAFWIRIKVPLPSASNRPPPLGDFALADVS